MEDVTDKVLSGVNDKMTGDEREKWINANINTIRKQAVEGTGYSANYPSILYGKSVFSFCK